jgi:nucleoside-diphosphate-sugar epimerase
MKIVVTGATGFIGSHFTKQALLEGHSVLALRRSPGSKPRIPFCQEPHWLDRGLDEVSVEDLKGFDVLVHLASHSVQYPFDTLANCLRWNLMAVLAMFEKARLAGIQQYVVAGSCFEYGRSGERYEAIPTDAPLEPTNSYAVSKAAASIALRQWAEEHQLNLQILRVFHVYGEGEAETRFWPSLRRAALAGKDLPMTSGEQIRDFMPVEAVAATFLARAQKGNGSNPCSEILNLSSGNPCSLREFAADWWQIFRAKGSLLYDKLPYRNGEVMRYIPGEKSMLLLTPESPSYHN